MKLVKLSKLQLNFMRSDDSTWKSFLDEVMLFYNKYDIKVKCMDDIYLEPEEYVEVKKRRQICTDFELRFLIQ